MPISVTVNENNDVVYQFVADDIDTETLTFAEEPCGLTAEQGFGYLQVDFGERFGPDGRFEILRKLGYGNYSSVWLARDTLADRHVAIKALTGYGTYLCKEGALLEHYILQRISTTGGGSHDAHDAASPSIHCLTEIDRFIEAGKDKEDGMHLCFVTDPLGPSVRQIMHHQEKQHHDRKRLIKRILRDTLVGLAHLHELRIAHTDIYDANILMDLGSGPSAFNIKSFIEKEPAQRYPPERTRAGKHTQVAVSQPFPVPSAEDCMKRNFVITDFGSAQLVDHQVTNTIMPPALRAPEVVLGFPWDEKVDIWAFGCLVFELIHSERLIKRVGQSALPYEILVLWQMLAITDERLPADTILSSETAMKYLDPYTGWLNNDIPQLNLRFSTALKELGVLSKTEDLVGVEALLRKCLRLQPKDRFSAKDLLDDHWLHSET